MLHHVHKHKKKNNLSNDAWDFLLYFFVFTTPLFEIPQAYLIYSKKDADGVSVLTWVYFAASSVVWLIYGLRKKLKPVIFSYTLYLIIETIIVVGILKYN